MTLPKWETHAKGQNRRKGEKSNFLIIFFAGIERHETPES